VAFGDDQHVGRPLRVDIVERKHAIVFVHNRCRDLALDDLAEETVSHGTTYLVRLAIAVRAIPCRSRHTSTSLSARLRPMRCSTAIS